MQISSVSPLITVATDFSTRSDRALRRAIMLARQTGARLLLVHVVDDDQPVHLIDAQLSACRPMLEETARTISQLDGVPASATVISGDLAGGILQVADAAEASFIVLGPHRRQLRDAFIGTTAERTIARARRPVLIAAGVPAAAYARIMFALAMDDASKAAIGQVQGIGLGGPEIIGMHAFDAPARGMMKRAMSEPQAIEHYVAGEARRAEETFDAFLTAAGLGSAARLLLPLDGTTGHTILHAAKREAADLIVVGTRQMTGLRRLLLGSVAADVLGEADRDVLVVPPV